MQELLQLELLLQGLQRLELLLQERLLEQRQQRRQIDQRLSGLMGAEGGKVEVRLDLKWTFPLAYAEIITGDGRAIKRRRVDLSTTGSFGDVSFKIDADVTDQRWLRVEVWDVATNGAFTQPVWLNRR